MNIYNKKNEKIQKDVFFFALKKQLIRDNDKIEKLSDLLEKISIYFDLDKTNQADLIYYIEIILGSYNKYGLKMKEINNISYIYLKETPAILESHSSPFSDITERINFIKNIVDLFKQIQVLFVFELFLWLSNLFLITDDTKQYVYPIYSLMVLVFIFFVFKFNYKIILISLSFFGIIKYLMYYIDEMSKFYYQTITFDLYVFSISCLLIFFIFTIEYFIFLLYLILCFILQSLTLFYFYILAIIKNKKFKNLFSIIILNILIVIVFHLDIVEMDKISYFLTIFLVINLNIINIFIFVFLDTGFKHSPLDNQLEKNLFITKPIFMLLKNINLKISKIHQNLDFIEKFTFHKLGYLMSSIYLLMVLFGLYNIYNFYHYFQSYSYNKSFFEKNNNYCLNINSNQLILKNINSNSTVFIISDNKIDSSYVYRSGQKNKDSIKPDEKYYIYEKRCLKNIIN